MADAPGPPGPTAYNVADYETVFTNPKAGMDGVDRDRVRQIVYEMSKNSAHFKHEQRRNSAADKRIARYRASVAACSEAKIRALERTVDRLLAPWQRTRDLARTFLHVDMDAFFAAVEAQRDPSLIGTPYAVGDVSMISTASYAARRYGVRSAMPGFIGRALCPQLRFVPARHSLYREASRRARVALPAFDQGYRMRSLDEASLEVTARLRRTGETPEACAEALRAAVRSATGGLTCSVGVGPTPMLAKIAADERKPDGQLVLPGDAEAVATFLGGKSCRCIPGIGRLTERELAGLGVETCDDLVRLRARVAAAWGVEAAFRPAPPSVRPSRKGISMERSFRPTGAYQALAQLASECARSVAAQMRDEGIVGRTVTLKLKAPSFDVRTRAQTLGAPTADEAELERVALGLLRAEMPVQARLLGVRVSNLAAETKRQRVLGDLFTASGVEAAVGAELRDGEPAPGLGGEPLGRGGTRDDGEVACPRDLGDTSGGGAAADRRSACAQYGERNGGGDGGLSEAGEEGEDALSSAASPRRASLPSQTMSSLSTSSRELSLRGWVHPQVAGGSTDGEGSGAPDAEAAAGARAGGPASDREAQGGATRGPDPAALGATSGDSPPPSPRARVGAAPVPLVQHPPEIWACPTCTLHNPRRRRRCEACDTAGPESVEGGRRARPRVGATLERVIGNWAAKRAETAAGAPCVEPHVTLATLPGCALPLPPSGRSTTDAGLTAPPPPAAYGSAMEAGPLRRLFMDGPTALPSARSGPATPALAAASELAPHVRGAPREPADRSDQQLGSASPPPAESFEECEVCGLWLPEFDLAAHLAAHGAE